MAIITFIKADIAQHKDVLIAMNMEYMGWVAANIAQDFGITTEALLGMPLAEYVPGALDKICGADALDGMFYLVEVDGQYAAMGGRRGIQDSIAEIKRLYVLPAFRGLHLGDTLLQHLLNDVRKLGYQRVRLDSAPFMQAAHSLYETAGFKDCPPYEGAEVPAVLHPRWRFMELIL
ncbi:GNAT family N-acetyltransferase [Undibacterium sp. Tian12W]|uniref:GNAT family N-acetyltransferase n=1 Tax=Undibacterium sp. Tian12W TaxID=3413054 RepID=UPI003BF33140